MRAKSSLRRCCRHHELPVPPRRDARIMGERAHYGRPLRSQQGLPISIPPRALGPHIAAAMHTAFPPILRGIQRGWEHEATSTMEKSPRSNSRAPLTRSRVQREFAGLAVAAVKVPTRRLTTPLSFSDRLEAP